MALQQQQQQQQLLQLLLLLLLLLQLLPVTVCQQQQQQQQRQPKQQTLTRKKEVTNLPGMQSPAYKLFSGYLDGRTGAHLFYAYVPKQQQPKQQQPKQQQRQQKVRVSATEGDVAVTAVTDDRDDNAVGLWLNGGPGCSSLGGFLATNGPLFVHDNGSAVWHNQWAWSQELNMLYVEAPVGVGFSFAETWLPKSQSLNDFNTTQDLRLALRQFADLYPTRSGQPRRLILMGESYAGVYLSLLAAAVLADAELTKKLKLDGLSMGNAYVMGREMMFDGRMRFAQILGFDPEADKPPMHTLNMYNIGQVCYAQPDTLGFDAVEAYECLNTTAMVTYLDSAAVQAAMGVSSRSNTTYRICRGQVFYSYQFNVNSMAHLRDLLLKHQQLRLLLYSGSLDYLVPHTATLQFAESLFNDSRHGANNWFYCLADGKDKQLVMQLGGRTVKYMKGRVMVTSVLTAGHSVPADNPQAALQMLRNFLNPDPDSDKVERLPCNASSQLRPKHAAAATAAAAAAAAAVVAAAVAASATEGGSDGSLMRNSSAYSEVFLILLFYTITIVFS